METSAITRYYELRRQQMEIERELEALQPAVAGCLRQQQGVAHLDGYDLLLKTYTAWTYSPKVEEMQKALTETRKRERLDGQATVRERRDMLVLRPQRGTVGELHEEPAPYGEWERDDTLAADSP